MSILTRVLMWYKFQFTFLTFDIAELRHRWLAKRKMSPAEEENISGQVVVITGAGKGIGKASALEFAKRKATVVMGCFDMKEGIKAMQEIKKETGNLNVEVMHLDLSDMDIVQKFALAVAGKYPKIKILFNNAGLGVSKTLDKTKEGFNVNVAVNYLGHFLLTNLLLDNLQLAGSARVICMTSTAGLLLPLDLNDFMMEKKGTGFWGGIPFIRTSFSNALFMRELGERMAGKGVTTYSVCPGAVKTDIFDSLRTSAVRKSIVGFVLWVHGFTAEQTASEVIMYCALSKRLAKKTGKMLRFKQNFRMGNNRMTPELSLKLWNLSSQLVRLDERILLFKNDINTLNNQDFLTPL